MIEFLDTLSNYNPVSSVHYPPPNSPPPYLQIVSVADTFPLPHYFNISFPNLCPLYTGPNGMLATEDYFSF